MSDAVEQLTLFDLDTWSGKMCPEPSVPREAKTSGLSWRKLSELKLVPVQCLDLTPGVGNLLGQSYWEINSHWLGELWTLNTGAVSYTHLICCQTAAGHLCHRADP